MRQLPQIISILALLLSNLVIPEVAHADARYQQVVVADAYLELHTGPGRGYPVFHVVERGSSVEVLKRRTDWFKVRTEDRREGWVARAQMLNTLQPTGELTRFNDGSLAQFAEHNWEVGVLAGDFDGASVISAYGAWLFNPSLSLEVGASHVLGEFSNSYVATAGIAHVLVPEWRISPLVTLGTGVISIEPQSTLGLPEDRTDQVAYAGVGLRVYVARRVMARVEYKSYMLFTSRDDNEEIDEWKAGFAFFF